MTHQISQLIWDPLLRLLHWLIACGFLLNYWILPQGDFWHRLVGYALFCIVIVRIFWGFRGPTHARFNSNCFQVEAWKRHFFELKSRQFSASEGHNPFGYVWLYLALILLCALASTGFMLEEIDYFFGSDKLEAVHGYLADALFALVCIHIFAVFLMQWWGGIPLIKPMITGKR